MGTLAAGDRVQVIEHSDPKYIGERGTVIHVETGIEPDTQPIVVKHPKQEIEPRYSVVTDEGGVLHNLREQQLRKLQGTTYQQEK
jgi:hypothetical protein